MKIKRVLTLMLFAVLAFSMMGCPAIINRPPVFVQMVDGVPQSINSVTYNHVKGTEFDPTILINDLVENQNIRAIDYNQTEVVWGKERKYEDISDAIIITNFYERWEDDSDANRDGVVDEADEALWGTLKTDEEGKYVLDQGIIFLIEFITPVGGTFAFTMRVTDSEGARAEISGVITIVAPEE